EAQLPQLLRDRQTPEELDCKICYCAYNLGSRRPKVLECCHRLCAKCLTKIMDLGESPPNAVVCPFCRYVTRLSGETVSNLPDDCKLVTVLAIQSRNQKNLHFYHEANTELLLSPRHLSSLMGTSASNQDLQLHHQPHGSHTSNLDYRSSSLDSMASITHRWTVWNCAALLCQTSAPGACVGAGAAVLQLPAYGVYLLIMQRTTLGVLLVSLVPASLVMIMVYGFCQCICHELWDCMPP
uniref:E3 ubiquitin-protein ligase RNF182 n=1 Tax=Anabas testudineus TaxID=64144 RepID=A0A3Q1IKK6_ANATE